MSVAPCGFSEYLELGDELTARKAVMVYRQYRREVQAAGGLCDWHAVASGSAVWIYDGQCCNTRQVVEYVHRVAERLRLTGKWGMSWADLNRGIKAGQIFGGAVRLELGRRGSEQWIDSRDYIRKNADGDWQFSWTGTADLANATS